MTEKEKMLQSESYNSRDPELIAQYHKARRLFQEYNHLASTAIERREEILTDLMKEKGKRVWIEAPFFSVIMESIYS